jgi:hypothetical protein
VPCSQRHIDICWIANLLPEFGANSGNLLDKATIFALIVCMTWRDTAVMSDWSLLQMAAGSVPGAASGVVDRCRSLLIPRARSCDGCGIEVKLCK